jgi:hypothetical protein
MEREGRGFDEGIPWSPTSVASARNTARGIRVPGGQKAVVDIKQRPPKPHDTAPQKNVVLSHSGQSNNIFIEDTRITWSKPLFPDGTDPPGGTYPPVGSYPPVSTDASAGAQPRSHLFPRRH